MRHNLELLQKHYIDKGLIVKQDHPTLPLSIYNYSRECQYEGKWDRYTMACRGLILDREGNVIAKTFAKFFNWEEIKDDTYAHCEGCRNSGMINCAHFDECGGWEMRSVIPNEDFEVYEKLDGSLGIIFHYNDEWHIASKGSFTSDQAIKGKELFDKLPKDELDSNNTYLVEILYQTNRIVLDYGDYEGLILLGAYNRETGNEIERSVLENIKGWELVKTYNFKGKSWDEIKEQIPDNEEGYVVRFKSGFRIKIKGMEYLRLHRIISNFSTREIWELLRNGESLEPFLERVPDEFDNWVKGVVNDLKTKHKAIKDEVEAEFNQLINKKEYAEKVKGRKYEHLLFKRLTSYSTQLDEQVWDMIYPEYNKPFSIN